jgi:hypothetical protein
MNVTRTITPTDRGFSLTLKAPKLRKIRIEGELLTVEEIFIRMHEDGFTIDETFAWIERRSRVQ